MLTPGSPAPLSITVHDLHNKQVSLANYLGSWIVVYFYPKDNTPGCTIEACEFRDWNEKIRSLHAVIIGISSDTVDSHRSFQKKHNLSFELWSDPEKKLLTAFKATGKSSIFNALFMGIKRSTVIIDPKGIIAHVWDPVTPVGHAKEVYSVLNRLINPSK